MLVGARAGAEPAVVSDVKEPARTASVSSYRRPVEISTDVAIEPSLVFAARNCVAGENDFVTDQRQKIRRPRRWLIVPALAGDESAAYFGELHETEPLEQVLKRQVLAERHEMNLVIHGKDQAAVADHVDRVVRPRDGGAGRCVGRADGTSNQHGSRRQELANLCKCLRLAHEKEGECRFWPDQNADIAQAHGLRAVWTFR